MNIKNENLSHNTIKNKLEEKSSNIQKDNESQVQENPKKTECLHSYTFKNDANLVSISNNQNIFDGNESYTKIKPIFIPKRISIYPDDVLMQSEFYYNTYVINNKLHRAKTKEVSMTKRFAILTRTHIKFSKSKNIYISYGHIFSEIRLPDIVKCEIVKNPFSKIRLYTINIKYGKESGEISLSSEDEKETEAWYKILSHFQKSVFV